MRRKNKDVKEDPITENFEIAQPTCGAWCFLLGLANGVFCPLDQNHEGRHEIQIESFTDPQARFTITWELTSDM